MNKFSVTILISALSLSLSSVKLSAQATITYNGVQYDVDPGGASTDTTVGWRNTNPTKTYDIDGNNILGTDGWDLFGVTPTNVSLPGYVSAITISSGIANGSFAGYSNINNPMGGANIQSGTLYLNGATAGTEHDMFSFTLQNTVPGTFAISLMVDNTNDSMANLAGAEIRVRQTAGSGMSTGVLSIAIVANQKPDWYTFSISGGAAGDVFTVSELNPTAGGRNLQLGAVAFDHLPVPEPSSFAFLALGGLATIGLTVRRGRS